MSAALSVPQALQLLEVQPGASLKQIRASYKRLALQLHPDKQHQQQQRQQRSADATSEFALLSAAYSLLVQGCSTRNRTQPQQQQHSRELPPFETAYATGSLFTDKLVDEAVLCGAAAPADIFNLQQLAAVAVQGGQQLAQHLAANAPTAADEQLWRQLYRRMELRQHARQQALQQQQQQQQAEGCGVAIGDLLSDLLLRPSGNLYVAEEDEDEEQSEGAALTDSEPGSGTGATATVHLQQQQQQQLLAGAVQLAQGGGVTGSNCTAQAVPQPGQQLPLQQQVQQQLHAVSAPQPTPQPKQQRLRHGWGFYWMWLRRALLAKAVVSVLSSSLRAKMYEHRFPEPLPL